MARQDRAVLPTGRLRSWQWPARNHLFKEILVTEQPVEAWVGGAEGRPAANESRVVISSRDAQVEVHIRNLQGMAEPLSEDGQLEWNL